MFECIKTQLLLNQLIRKIEYIQYIYIYIYNNNNQIVPAAPIVWLSNIYYLNLATNHPDVSDR